MELDPDTEWTLLSYKAYRSIGSEVPLRQAEEILETKTGVSLEVVGRASIVLQLGQFHRRTEVLVVDGLDVDLTLGLVWYEQNEDFVSAVVQFRLNSDVLGDRDFGSEIEWRQAEYASMQLLLQTPVTRCWFITRVRDLAQK